MKQSKTDLKQLINSFDRSNQLYLEYYLSNIEMENELVWKPGLLKQGELLRKRVTTTFHQSSKTVGDRMITVGLQLNISVVGVEH